MKLRNSLASLAVVNALFVTGCGEAPTPPGSTPPPDPSDAIYDPDHMLEVSIEMAAADWETLRHQINNVDELIGADCQDAPLESVYSYFPGKVTVDGNVLENVGIRKKGFLGSASLTKPSLKLDLGEYVKGQEFSGVEKLTLNNALQDLSLVKQCLALQVFHDAGVPASRCNFAHVTVNGKDLGVYVNIESVGRRMLRYLDIDDTGNLYEGGFSDFRTGWTGTYEKKTNETDPDRSDIDAVTAALGASDAELEGKLGKVLDIDEFMRFWAVESLVGAGDGYTNNQNNHFVYHDPSTGKMIFMPWSPDLSFTTDDPFMPDERPQSVSANGAIPNRLYKVPAMRTQYVTHMNEALSKAWKETGLLGEIDRMEKQIKPLLKAEEAAYMDMTLMSVRDFINGRRAAITAEISNAPDWTYPLKSTACYTLHGLVSGSVSTTYGTNAVMNPFNTGQGTFDFESPVGMKESSNMTGSAAGLNLQSKLGVSPEMQLLGIFPSGKLRVIVFFIDPEVFVPGVDIPFDWQSGFGYVLNVLDAEHYEPLGALVHGSIKFDSAGMKEGDKVSASFKAEFAN